MRKCAETNCGKMFQPRNAETVCPECWKIEADSIAELEPLFDSMLKKILDKQAK
jgi:hypothetical protein